LATHFQPSRPRKTVAPPTRLKATHGALEVGRLADLAVLSKDLMTAPAEDIGGIESLLTMVGGCIVYAAGPYRRWMNEGRGNRASAAITAPFGAIGIAP
jgi:Amidohydrolase family